MKLLTIIGTRPEAVKMAPVLLRLKANTGVSSLLCTTGQHQSLCEEPLSFFGLCPDFRLDLMEEGQSLNQLMARALIAIDGLLTRERPDRVIVHGDTSTALAAALAAANLNIPVSHVEAGLRTYNHRHPWPEEHNRRGIDTIADQLFAPTLSAARNLAEEKVTGRVAITGNSGIDALYLVLNRLAGDATLRWRSDAALPGVSSPRPLVLATTHRRENIGEGLHEICAALSQIVQCDLADVAIPVHPNPAVGALIRASLANRPGVHLLPPLSLPSMIRLMQRAHLILTDSGGIQEEAPSLGKTVLVTREVTERPEAVESGLARLVGTNRNRIVAEVRKSLAESPFTSVCPVTDNPYGDGRAAHRIVGGLLGIAVDAFEAQPIRHRSAPLRLAG